MVQIRPHPALVVIAPTTLDWSMPGPVRTIVYNVSTEIESCNFGKLLSAGIALHD